MFRKNRETKPTASTETQSLEDIIRIIKELASQSDEQTDAKVRTLPIDKLNALIDATTALLDIPAQIEDTFQFTVGYPSKEAAIRGIHYYADGTVRREGEKLDRMFESFLSSSSILFPLQEKLAPQKPTAQQEAEKKASDESLAMLEQHAKFYLQLMESKAVLEKQIGIMTAARDNRNELRQGKSYKS